MRSILRETRALKKLLIKSIQSYWRFSRGLTMGAQGCVIRSDGHVLLIQHTYRPGWFFPGGGVEKDETVWEALERELWEEACVKLSPNQPPELFGVYANHQRFAGDHVVLFVVRDWTQPVPPKPDKEIAAHQFVDPGKLPHDIHAPTAARISEIFFGAAPSRDW